MKYVWGYNYLYVLCITTLYLLSIFQPCQRFCVGLKSQRISSASFNSSARVIMQVSVKPCTLCVNMTVTQTTSNTVVHSTTSCASHNCITSYNVVHLPLVTDFQNYLRTQAGNTTTVNIITCTVDYLLRLQESVSDFYWHYSGQETIDLLGRDSLLRAFRVAKQVFRTLTEYIQVTACLQLVL